MDADTQSHAEPSVLRSASPCVPHLQGRSCLGHQPRRPGGALAGREPAWRPRVVSYTDQSCSSKALCSHGLRPAPVLYGARRCVHFTDGETDSKRVRDFSRPQGQWVAESGCEPTSLWHPGLRVELQRSIKQRKSGKGRQRKSWRHDVQEGGGKEEGGEDRGRTTGWVPAELLHGSGREGRLQQAEWRRDHEGAWKMEKEGCEPRSALLNTTPGSAGLELYQLSTGT